ncbi:unnamed protein product [Nezara viridula]|uniref:Phosphoglycolate phosphatase n=1 Tax=Nezara viridula TaxID=85310 RepID=A0A9P0MXY9_NEZVI|nr:unnamed protein product [Nezara viridula]
MDTLFVLTGNCTLKTVESAKEKKLVTTVRATLACCHKPVSIRRVQFVLLVTRYVKFSNSSMTRKMIDFSKLSEDGLREFKNRYDAYIFDMDETLIQQNGSPIEGVEEALNEIAENGKSIMVFTDNCLAVLKDVAERLNGLFPVIKKENIMNAGHLVVRYLKEINFKKKVYVIGSENGIIADLKDSGFDVLYENQVRVGAVVIGSDLNFNYLKMFNATNYLADPEVLLIQTHVPVVVAYNPIIPGVGAIIASLKAVSGRKDSTATGKGSDYCSKYLKSFGFPAERCLFVGDGISNDVVAGNRTGMDTMLVLTGASSLENVEKARAENLHEQIPTYYANSVADLIKAFKT